MKDDQNRWQGKHRRVMNAIDRLCEFKKATMYNAIFICICCHQRMFQSNVRLYTKQLKFEINEKKAKHTEACIGDPIPIRIDEKENSYICLTCVAHMKRKKVPPMSVMNGLKLNESDAQLKDQELEMTELEGALIAKNILFQKIYQLPKSRWTALKDRVVNVPINEGSIINTLEQLPRTPEAAGLIGVALKRKIEYKNNHKHQLINPDKLFRMLDKLKSSKNPYYQFYDDHNIYKARCKTSDPEGYQVIFTDELKEDIEVPDGSHKRK